MNVIHPGFVVSRNDGDRHWITADRIIRLYHLEGQDNRVAREWETHWPADAMHYFPDPEGKYDPQLYRRM